MGDTAQPQRRWFHPTPDRLISALLVMEGVLLLSDRLRCPPFNQYKGLAVVIAVASVGAAMLVMLAWLAGSLLFRWRFQFRLRSLFVLTVAVALVCSWLSVEMKNASRQEAIVAAIQKAGGWTLTDDEEHMMRNHASPNPTGPAWLQEVRDNAFFRDITHVVFFLDPSANSASLEHLKGLPHLETLGLGHSQIGDAALEHVEGLTQIQRLCLYGERITDAGVEHIKALTQLKELDLTYTRVTDAGLKHLEGLTELQRLTLDNTPITGVGLEHLKGLTELRRLTLDNTRATGVGLEHLKGLPHLHVLSLVDTPISDAGLEHIKELTQLQYLNLSVARRWPADGGTPLTDAGLEHVKGLTQLRGLRLRGAHIRDAALVYLKGLPRLEELDLEGTWVTDDGWKHLKGLAQLQHLVLSAPNVTVAGVKQYKHALPNCRITYCDFLKSTDF